MHDPQSGPRPGGKKSVAGMSGTMSVRNRRSSI